MALTHWLNGPLDSEEKKASTPFLLNLRNRHILDRLNKKIFMKLDLHLPHDLSNVSLKKWVWFLVGWWCWSWTRAELIGHESIEISRLFSRSPITSTCSTTVRFQWTHLVWNVQSANPFLLRAVKTDQRHVWTQKRQHLPSFFFFFFFFFCGFFFLNIFVSLFIFRILHVSYSRAALSLKLILHNFRYDFHCFYRLFD